MAAPTHSLRPPQTGGRTFMPGYHRTEVLASVASILLDTIKPGRDSCLYGPGFYMSRTFVNHTREDMIDNYGTFLVKCQVDVSGFICFDRAVAKRLWADKYRLIDQLEAALPKSVFDTYKSLIRDWSLRLEKFWSHRGVFKQRYMNQSSDCAKQIAKGMALWENVPGIFYTGETDGPCLLAYDLTRVKPLRGANLPANKVVNERRVAWIKTHEKQFQRLHAPVKVLEQDIATYQQVLTRNKNLTVNEHIGLMRNSWTPLRASSDVHEQLAFFIALLRSGRGAPYTDVRTQVFRDFGPTLVKNWELTMPYFKSGTSVEIGETKTLEQFRPLLERDARFWDYMRAQLFENVTREHLVYFKFIVSEFAQNAGQKDVFMGMPRHARRIFCHYLRRYGEPVVYKTPPIVRDKIPLTDGTHLLLDVFYKRRLPAGCATSAYQNVTLDGVAKPKSKTETLLPKVFCAHDSYARLIHGHWLALYAELRNHKRLQKNKTISNMLSRWWRHFGKAYTAELGQPSRTPDFGFMHYMISK